RHTRFSRDWRSDVCSSDLAAALGVGPRAAARTSRIRDRKATGRRLPVECRTMVTAHVPPSAVGTAARRAGNGGPRLVMTAHSTGRGSLLARKESRLPAPGAGRGADGSRPGAAPPPRRGGAPAGPAYSPAPVS